MNGTGVSSVLTRDRAERKIALSALAGAPGKAARVIYGRSPLVALALAALSGVLFWGGFNWGMELTNTEGFCVSCHAMKAGPYAEYRRTVHYENRTGVRATCPDCHVPRQWVHKLARKIRASGELWGWLRGRIATREKYEARRGHLARLVWRRMKASDSRECRNCHAIGFMKKAAQNKRAAQMHELAGKWGMSCIECHQGVAHKLPADFDRAALMDGLHERMEKEKINCRICHEGMAGPPPGEGW
jgi:cytochrome c-type protein NapC